MEPLPLVSLCLFTYNQATYVDKAVRAALAQDYEPLEIIISDDHSEDRTVPILQELVAKEGRNRRIVLNLNASNMGLGAHVSYACRQIATGKFIVTIAGDDISDENHVSRAVRRIIEIGRPMVDMAARVIDNNGVPCGWMRCGADRIDYSYENYLRRERIPSFAPGRIFDRALIDDFAPISHECPTEDSVLVLRSLLRGGFARVDDCVLQYRRHDRNLSSFKSLATLSNDAIIRQYGEDAKTALEQGFISRSQYALLMARHKLEGDIRSARYRAYANIWEKLLRKIPVAFALAHYECLRLRYRVSHTKFDQGFRTA